ncbi:MAG: dUTP diphosphatase [Dietzia sp.]
MSNSDHPAGSGGPLRLRRLDPGLPVPSRAHPSDAGIDLYSAEDCELAPGQRSLVGTGVSVAIPEGYVGLVHPRSGLAARAGLSIVNAPGTVDAGYRGEIRVNLVNLDPSEPVRIGRGDRIAQLLIQRVELWDVLEVHELDQTERGERGHGSTGGHHRLT